MRERRKERTAQGGNGTRGEATKHYEYCVFLSLCSYISLAMTQILCFLVFVPILSQNGNSLRSPRPNVINTIVASSS